MGPAAVGDIFSHRVLPDRTKDPLPPRVIFRSAVYGGGFLLALLAGVIATHTAVAKAGLELGVAEALAATPADIPANYRDPREPKIGSALAVGVAGGVGKAVGKYVVTQVGWYAAASVPKVMLTQEAADDGGPLGVGHVEVNNIEWDDRLTGYLFAKRLGLDLPTLRQVNFTMTGFCVKEGKRSSSEYMGSGVVDGSKMSFHWHSARGGAGGGTLTVDLTNNYGSGHGTVSARDSRRGGYIGGAALLTHDIRNVSDPSLKTRELMVTPEPLKLSALSTKDQRLSTKDFAPRTWPQNLYATKDDGPQPG